MSVFVVRNGVIHPVNKIHLDDGGRVYFSSCPRNFLEIVDELKKLSLQQVEVYVMICESTMQIFVGTKKMIETQKKFHTSDEPVELELNERLRDFLFSMME